MYTKIQKRTSELLSKGNISDKPSQYVDMVLFILILLNSLIFYQENFNRNYKTNRYFYF